jgi:hypothetical protein
MIRHLCEVDGTVSFIGSPEITRRVTKTSICSCVIDASIGLWMRLEKVVRYK